MKFFAPAPKATPLNPTAKDIQLPLNSILWDSKESFLSAKPLCDMLEIEVYDLSKLDMLSDAERKENCHYKAGMRLTTADYTILSLSRRLPVRETVIVNPGYGHVYTGDRYARDSSGKIIYERVTDILYAAPDSYDELMRGRNLTAGIKKLFNDYHRPCEGAWYGFFLHPNRSHKAEALTIEMGVEGKDNPSMREYLLNKRHDLLVKGANPAGSIIRRLEKAIGAIDELDRTETRIASAAVSTTI